MKTSEKGIELIKKFEGFKSSPYLCPAGIPTIGYGSTRYCCGRKVKLNDEPINEEEATDLLECHLIEFERIVNRSIKICINQNQFDALVSHTYNTGGSDTLFNIINTNKGDLSEWWLNTYITANGIELKGLVSRRGEELELFFDE